MVRRLLIARLSLAAAVAGSFCGRTSVRADEAVEFKAGDFSESPAPGLFLIDFEQNDVKPLGSLPQFAWVGSPAYAPDGKTVALDGVRPGRNIDAAEIVLVDVANRSARSLGTGLMPSWKPDGKHVVCSRYENGVGAWCYDLANPRKPEELERGAWGVQLSPDGKHCALSKAGSLLVKHLESGQVYEYPYSTDAKAGEVGWSHNFAWSPDGRRICGVVGLENGQQSVMILTLKLPARPPAQRGPLEVRQGDFQLVLASARPMNQRDISWHPLQPQVVVTLFHEPLAKQQLFAFNPQTISAPWVLPMQPPVEPIDHCWSPDGKQLLCVGHSPQPPVGE